MRATRAPWPWTRLLVPGCYFVRPGSPTVWGRSLTLEELEASERESGFYGDEAALQKTLRMAETMIGRGYLYGWHYSSAEEGGDLLSTPISAAMPISQELFERAERANWVADHELIADIAHYVALVATGGTN